MTYAAGGTIAATDYNTLANGAGNIGAQWGVGSGNHGLGQSTTAIANVAAGNNVTAAQWTGLIQTINSCLAHEGQTTITPTSVTAGTAITYYSAITTGSAAAYANTGATSLARTNSAASASSYTGAWGTTGNRGLTLTHTVTFASGDAARYFFNAGGRLKLTFSRSGGSATTRNTEWSTLCAECGSIEIAASDYIQVGKTGTSVVFNLLHDGYYGRAATPGTSTDFFRQADNTGSYSSNYIQCLMSVSGTAQNGGYPTITITTHPYNVWVNAFQPGVDGTFSASLVVASPATTYLTNTWGTPTVTPSAGARY